MGSRLKMIAQKAFLFLFHLFISQSLAQEFEVTTPSTTDIPFFNVSLDGGCLKCGSECLSAVTGALPACLDQGLNIGGTMIGGMVDLSITADVFRCVRGLLDALSSCRDCIESLVCCVTDSCDFCECNCHNLLRFSAPLGSPTREEHPWLFTPQCHFAYIGTPDCCDCDGKRVYEAIDCNRTLFLHYHDYILDGRWVLTEDMDSNDKTSVVRNRGDGLDDEECPEKETFEWELRSSKAPRVGWFKDPELVLEKYLKIDNLRLSLEPDFEVLPNEV